MKHLIPIFFTTSFLFLAADSYAQTAQPSATPAEPVGSPASHSEPQTAVTNPQPVAASPVQPRAIIKPTDRCVQHTAKDVAAEIPDQHLNGPALATQLYFIPAGAPVKVALNEPYKADTLYFALILTHWNNAFYFLEGAAFNAEKIPDNDPLVTQNLVDSSSTLFTMRVPAAAGGVWGSASLYVWTCDTATGRPAYLSELDIRTISPVYSAIIIGLLVIIIYLAAAAALSRKHRQVKWFKYLDPVHMTAGSDGKGSLSKLQILFFSLVVFGLLSFIVIRTGILSDISPSVLLLLGIAGVGSTAAKGTDVQTNTLSFDNRSWLVRKGWLPPGGWAAINEARWRDLITDDNGEFNVYRYQSCIFSLTVGGALLVGGVNELASFSIPESLLGILGLSQAVYVGGKLVSKSPVGELDTALDELRTLEKKFVDQSVTNPDPDPAAKGSASTVAIRRAGAHVHSEYIEKAKSVRTLFESLTGKKIEDSQLAPNVVI